MSSHPISTIQPTTTMIVEWYILNKYGEINGLSLFSVGNG